VWAFAAVRSVVLQLWPAYLLGSILILYGFNWGLPTHGIADMSWHPDENGAAWAVNQIGIPLFNPGWLPWGTALFYQVFVLKEVVTAFGLIPIGAGGVIALGRIVVYASAMGALTMVFLLGRDLFGLWVGRIAAVMLAVAPGFAINSHYFKVEIPALFWMLVALWLIYRYGRSGRLSAGILAGLAAGYAASTQYSAGIVVLAGIAMIATGASIHRKRAAYKAFGVSAAVGFLFGTPYALLWPPELVRGLRMDLVINGRGQYYTVARPPAVIDYPLHVLPYSLTTPLLVLAVLGIFVALRRARRRLIPVWTMLGCYGLLLAIDNSRYVRLTLLLALFAALFLTEAWRSRLLRAPAVVAGAATVAFAFLFSLAYVQAFGTTDPRNQASRWLIQNVPRGSAIAVSTTTNHLQVPQVGEFGFRSIEVDRSVAQLHGAGVRYLILSDMELIPFEEAISHYPDVRAFTQLVAKDFCLMARFENSQALLGINTKPRGAALPADWLFPNPTISVLERRSAAGCSVGSRALTPAIMASVTS
jgi:4-amino-4-deoxy-L-arabinose transferase-like glycosyltransferase